MSVTATVISTTKTVLSTTTTLTQTHPAIACSNCGGGSNAAATWAAVGAAVFAAVTAFLTRRVAIAASETATATSTAAAAAADENRPAGYLDFFREYRQYEPDRRYVLRRLRDHDPDLGISELPDEARKHVVNVCHYLDHLGFLVDQRMIDLEAVDRLMGNSVLACGRELEPYIERERRRRAERRRPGEPPTPEDYAPYFDRLVEQLRDRRGDAELPRAYEASKPSPLERLRPAAMTFRPFAGLLTALSAMWLAVLDTARYRREFRNRHRS